MIDQINNKKSTFTDWQDSIDFTFGRNLMIESISCNWMYFDGFHQIDQPFNNLEATKLPLIRTTYPLVVMVTSWPLEVTSTVDLLSDETCVSDGLIDVNLNQGKLCSLELFIVLYLIMLQAVYWVCVIEI